MPGFRWLTPKPPSAPDLLQHKVGRKCGMTFLGYLCWLLLTVPGDMWRWLPQRLCQPHQNACLWTFQIGRNCRFWLFWHCQRLPEEDWTLKPAHPVWSPQDFDCPCSSAIGQAFSIYMPINSCCLKSIRAPQCQTLLTSILIPVSSRFQPVEESAKENLSQFSIFQKR